jgi:negative elongation factor A
VYGSKDPDLDPSQNVTDPEHCLTVLLCRDNPCPHLGNIVTIKLSENQENVPQTDNTYLTMIVETHFQVPYLNTFTPLVTIVPVIN